MSEVIVIGAGPAGLATAAALNRRGVPCRMIDRTGAPGGAYAKLEPDLLMTSPSRLTAMPGFAPTLARPYAKVRAYRDYLVAYAAAHGIAPEQGTVERVEREDGGYRVSIRRDDAVDDVSVRAVVVASGVFDFPVRQPLAGAPSIPVIHSSEWRNERARPGARVIVAGGATSAVEIAELAAQRGSVVTLATRKLSLGASHVLGIDLAYAVLPLFSHLSPTAFCERGVTVPAGDRGFRALRRAGAITLRPALARIDGATATFVDDTTQPVELVVLATGYLHACPFVPASVARTPRGTVRCHHNQSVSHPGLYLVGSPCARSAASQYLYGIARDAEATAATISLQR